jgi:hypothetical protein
MKMVETNAYSFLVDNNGRTILGWGKVPPSLDWITKGATFFDEDAQKEYYWTGAEWAQIPANPTFNESHWDDLRFNIADVAPGIANPPDWVQVSALGNLYVLAFNKNTQEEIYFWPQIPHRWEQGSTLHPHVHWINHEGTTGDVVWGLEYSVANINGVFPASTTVTATAACVALDGGLPVHQMTELPTIDMTGKTLSSMMFCRFYRVADDAADTADDDVGLLEVDFHYQIDSTGSRQEYVK